MEIYKNLSGQSNISRYEIGASNIIVEFKTRNKDGRNTYEYSYAKPGHSDIEHMKQLAIAGRGLNSFIKTHVGKNFARKW